jgi:hypothetical protein
MGGYMRAAIWVLAMLGLSLTVALAQESIVGTWACQSFASGAYTGRKCPLEPWLKIAPDKTYEWGREKGTWTYAGDVLALSGRAGTGRINADGKLVFEYDLYGKHYRMILYRRR